MVPHSATLVLEYVICESSPKISLCSAASKKSCPDSDSEIVVTQLKVPSPTQRTAFCKTIKLFGEKRFVAFQGSIHFYAAWKHYRMRTKTMCRYWSFSLRRWETSKSLGKKDGFAAFDYYCHCIVSKLYVLQKYSDKHALFYLAELS